MIIDIKTITYTQKNQLIDLVKLYFKEIEDETLNKESAIIYINNIGKQLEKYQTLHYLLSENNNKTEKKLVTFSNDL